MNADRRMTDLVRTLHAILCGAKPKPALATADSRPLPPRPRSSSE